MASGATGRRGTIYPAAPWRRMICRTVARQPAADAGSVPTSPVSFADAGMRMAVAARTSEQVELVAHEIGGLPLEVGVSDEPSVGGWSRRPGASWGRSTCW
jgi:hypothetical protein